MYILIKNLLITVCCFSFIMLVSCNYNIGNANSIRPQLNNDFSRFLVSSSKVPLHTSGRYILDSNNQRVKFQGANWYGASGSLEIGNSIFGNPFYRNSHHGDYNTHSIPSGLDVASIESIIQEIKSLGINVIRLPFSNQMLHDTNTVSIDAVKANPELFGKTPIQIYDYTVDALTKAGVMVVLNNHTTYTSWCCGLDFNGLWYNEASTDYYGVPIKKFTVEDWLNDWSMLVQRYKNNPMVVGADLRNEIRTASQWGSNNTDITNPNWSLNDQNSWKFVATTAGNNILKINPNMLIIVETINWSDATPITLNSGRRYSLNDSKYSLINLDKLNQVVYAIHEYGYTGPNSTGADKNEEYQDMSKKRLFETYDKEFGFILDNNIAPVWVSEFGVNGAANSSSKEAIWFNNLTEYLANKDVDFAYWPLMEPSSSKSSWGLLSITLDITKLIYDISTIKPSYSHPGIGIVNNMLNNSDIRRNGFSNILASNFNHAPIDVNKRINYIGLTPLEYTFTIGVYAKLHGFYREVICPNGSNVFGMSIPKSSFSVPSDATLLCGSSSKLNLELSNYRKTVNQEYGQNGFGDWAYGVDKSECPNKFMVVGYKSFTPAKFDFTNKAHISTVCEQIHDIPNEFYKDCKTMWLDQGISTESPKDWYNANDVANSVQVKSGWYFSGIAYNNDTPRAVLVCRYLSNKIAEYSHTSVDNQMSTCGKNGSIVVGLNSKGWKEGLCYLSPENLASSNYTTITNEANVGIHTKNDWANKTNKRECPLNQAVIKYENDGSSIACASPQKLEQKFSNNDCHTMWFDAGNNGFDGSVMEDWAPSAYKGLVSNDYYIAGIASGNGKIKGLLSCRKN